MSIELSLTVFALDSVVSWSLTILFVSPGFPCAWIPPPSGWRQVGFADGTEKEQRVLGPAVCFYHVENTKRWMERGAFQVQHFLLVVAIPGRGVFCGFCNELVGFPGCGSSLLPLPLQKATFWAGWVQGWSCWASASRNTPRPFLLGDQTFLRKRGPLFSVLIQRTGNSPHVKYSFQDLWESISGWCTFLCSFLWSKGRELLGETLKAGEKSASVNKIQEGDTIIRCPRAEQDPGFRHVFLSLPVLAPPTPPPTVFFLVKLKQEKIDWREEKSGRLCLQGCPSLRYFLFHVFLPLKFSAQVCTLPS